MTVRKHNCVTLRSCRQGWCLQPHLMAREPIKMTLENGRPYDWLTGVRLEAHQLPIVNCQDTTIKRKILITWISLQIFKIIIIKPHTLPQCTVNGPSLVIAKINHFVDIITILNVLYRGEVCVHNHPVEVGALPTLCICRDSHLL